MRRQGAVFVTIDAVQRLAGLGLTPQVLEFALRAAEAEARTYTPLDFRPRDTFGSLIIDGGLLFWARTADGVLTLLPQESGRGYGVGYGGGGPHELAQYIQKLIDTDGQDTAANASRYDDRVDPQILAWVSSKDADRTHELTLEDLKAIQRG